MSVHPTSSKATSEMAFIVNLCTANILNEKMFIRGYLRKLNEWTSGHDQHSSLMGKEFQVTNKCYVCLCEYLLLQDEAEASSLVL